MNRKQKKKKYKYFLLTWCLKNKKERCYCFFPLSVNHVMDWMSNSTAIVQARMQAFMFRIFCNLRHESNNHPAQTASVLNSMKPIELRANTSSFLLFLIDGEENANLLPAVSLWVGGDEGKRRHHKRGLIRHRHGKTSFLRFVIRLFYGSGLIKNRSYCLVSFDSSSFVLNFVYFYDLQRIALWQSHNRQRGVHPDKTIRPRRRFSL